MIFNKICSGWFLTRFLQGDFTQDFYKVILHKIFTEWFLTRFVQSYFQQDFFRVILHKISSERFLTRFLQSDFWQKTHSSPGMACPYYYHPVVTYWVAWLVGRDPDLPSQIGLKRGTSITQPIQLYNWRNGWENRDQNWWEIAK